MFAAESTTAALEAGWFLEHAWLIPVIPGSAFARIFMFGKRLPMLGAEFGIGSCASTTSRAPARARTRSPPG